MNVVVLCCDERMLQVSDNLSNDIDVVGVCNMEQLRLYRDTMDVLVLPVKGVDDEGHVKGFPIDQCFWSTLNQEVIIFSGLRTLFLTNLTNKVHYYMEDETVIHENAILTAEGVLNELIGCCQRSIYDVTIDVIGYGHCGKVIFEMLNNLQLQVRMIRRVCKEDEFFVSLDHWDVCGDVIINTSIQNVMDEKRMNCWDKKPVIIDIATPNVIDTACAQCLGIKVIKAGNLPGRFASVTAGNIIADFIRGKIVRGE